MVRSIVLKICTLLTRAKTLPRIKPLRIRRPREILTILFPRKQQQNHVSQPFTTKKTKNMACRNSPDRKNTVDTNLISHCSKNSHTPACLLLSNITKPDKHK